LPLLSPSGFCVVDVVEVVARDVVLELVRAVVLVATVVVVDVGFTLSVEPDRLTVVEVCRVESLPERSFESSESEPDLSESPDLSSPGLATVVALRPVPEFRLTVVLVPDLAPSSPPLPLFPDPFESVVVDGDVADGFADAMVEAGWVEASVPERGVSATDSTDAATSGSPTDSFDASVSATSTLLTDTEVVDVEVGSPCCRSKNGGDHVPVAAAAIPPTPTTLMAPMATTERSE
jgi:hypothetical protein